MPKKNEAQKKDHPWRKYPSTQKESWKKYNKSSKTDLDDDFPRTRAGDLAREEWIKILGKDKYLKWQKSLGEKRKHYRIIGPKTSEEWLNERKS